MEWTSYALMALTKVTKTDSLRCLCLPTTSHESFKLKSTVRHHAFCSPFESAILIKFQRLSCHSVPVDIVNWPIRKSPIPNIPNRRTPKERFLNYSNFASWKEFLMMLPFEIQICQTQFEISPKVLNNKTFYWTFFSKNFFNLKIVPPLKLISWSDDI